MDGTISDFYSVENWLPMLDAEKTTPYEIAKPLINMNTFARQLNRLQRLGHEIGIISWASKGANDEYIERINIAKRRWLKKHLGSVNWNVIKVVAYGMPKHECVDTNGAILFDDEERNRISWTGIAYDEKEIIKVINKYLI